MSQITFKKLEELAESHCLSVSRVKGNQGPYFWFTRSSEDETKTHDISFTITGNLRDRSLSDWDSLLKQNVNEQR